MKSAPLIAPRHIEIRQQSRLSPNAHQAVIEVEAVGVCGTDLALFSGDYRVPYPLVCGHEFVGRITSVGEGMGSQWINKRVTAEINNTCVTLNRQPQCIACKQGMPGHCLERNVTGIINHDGAFAEEVMVAGGTLHALPDELDSITATLTEPLAAALQTFEMTPVNGNETLVVLGPGRLGILIIFVAVLKGLKVIAVARSEAKRQRALKFGAIAAVSPDRAMDSVKEFTGGLGADIVVESSGHPQGIEQALSLVRPRGTISVKTTCGLPAKGLDMTKLVVDEISLQGSRCGPFPPALKILTKHQKKLKSLISSVRPLDDIQSAIESAFHEQKVVVQVKKNTPDS